MKLPRSFPILAALVFLGGSALAQTYQLGSNWQNTNGSGPVFLCSAASRYPISSPYQFNCNVVPLLDQNRANAGNLQLSDAGGWIMVHAPGIAEPQQYLESKFAPDMSQFSTPNSAGPGKVVWNYQITDHNGNLFHGTITAPWNDFSNWRGWFSPQLLTAPVDGTLTVSAGPLP